MFFIGKEKLFLTKSNTLSDNVHIVEDDKIEIASPQVKLKPYYLKIKADGRLGNQMFEWFSAKAIAKENHVNVCGVGFSGLTSAFETEVPTCPPLEVNESKLEKGYATYQHFTINENVYLTHSYLQSFKYYDNIDLSADLEFKPNLKQSVHNYFQRINFNINSDTLVAIHVRRGDIATQKWSWHNFPPNEYFSFAFSHFESKYPNVKYVLATNGYEWTKNNPVFQRDNIYFTGRNSPASVDLAILSHCNHTITSLGTFGWWIGWLTGGDVFYFFDQFKWDHPIPGKGLTPEDFWPNTWIKVMNKTLFPTEY